MAKNYRASASTTNKQMKDLLPNIFKNIEKNYLENSNLILNYWPFVIGEKLSNMTKAISFENKTLYVLVKSSTLYSILKREEKLRLLNLMQKKFSKEIIKNIIFKMG